MRSSVLLTAVLFALQINTAFGLTPLLDNVISIGGLEDLIPKCPLEDVIALDLLDGALQLDVLNDVLPLDALMDILPLDVILELPGIIKLLSACKCGISKEFVQDVADYTVYKNFNRTNGAMDLCCRPDQFRHLSKELACFSYCLQNAAALKLGQPLCKLLQKVSIFQCDKVKNPKSPGCLLLYALSFIFGPIGAFLGYTIVLVLDKFSYLDGCLIPAAAKYYSRTIYNKEDQRNYGNAVNPVGAVGGIVLGGLFAIFRCMGGVMSVMSQKAWEYGSKLIQDRCFKNAKNLPQPTLKTNQTGNAA